MLDAGPVSMPEAETLEMTVTRVLDAPRALVYDAFTLPIHLKRWWGPDHFTLPVCETDVRTGGTLHFVMRDSGGTEYPFRGVYLEVIPHARIVFTADLGGGPSNVVVTTVTFEEEMRFDGGDGRTWLTVRQTVPGSDTYARGQRQGWAESLERLDLYLAGR